jgi:uncharacterized damage-inducible protein DinB
MTLADRYRRWFEFEQDAHARVLASLDTVSLENRDEQALLESVELYAHMMSARLLWLYRFGVTELGPKGLFPTGVSLEELEEVAADTHATWADYLDRLDQEELDRIFEYKSDEGEVYSNSVEDILTQLFHHSAYHRGQIASRLKSLGGTPEPTDFVFWARTQVG